MASPSDNERSKASKLRKRVKAGEVLGDADRIWLADYEAARARKPLALPPGPPVAQRITPAIDDAPAPRNTHDAAGGELEPGEAVRLQPAAFVHETPREVRVENPDGMTWIPEVPPAVEAAEATTSEPTPGVPPRPKAGAPLVDEVTKPTDPTSGAKFGALVAMFAAMGLQAGRELLADMPIPDALRALLDSEQLTTETLAEFAQAGQGFAQKYFGKVGNVPDEVMVALALVGSGTLIVKNEKRKRLAVGMSPRAQPRPQPQPQPQRAQSNNVVDAQLVDEPPSGEDAPTTATSGRDPLAALLGANPK